MNSESNFMFELLCNAERKKIILMQNDNACLNLFIFPKCFEITLWVLWEETGEFADFICGGERRFLKNSITFRSFFHL